ncbi:MAG: dTDP-4-dehydrorhamnose reductase [Magnetococcales bacterium]|nr:dTDP-4-dehydrorhamnose reductase [Magnetococcales bacterium]
MKLLITGANGQVGREVARMAPDQGWHTSAPERSALDITDPQAVLEAMDTFRPDMVINAAACTAVDEAETNPAPAWSVNRDGARHLATACARFGSGLLHLSTDYVFDGAKPTPYLETDPPAPLGVYGASKWAGEVAIRENCPRHLIFRVSWVFGFHGKNFLKTILRLAREREALSVVQDQRGAPTPADAIAHMLLTVAEKALDPGFDQWGLYHYRGTPETDWWQFARFIVATASRYQPLPVREVRPITTAQFPTPARRPAHSVLNCDRIRERLAIQPPEWQTHASELLRRMLS